MLEFYDLPSLDCKSSYELEEREMVTMQTEEVKQGIPKINQNKIYTGCFGWLTLLNCILLSKNRVSS